MAEVHFPIADKPTLDQTKQTIEEINGKIGSNLDTGGGTTLFSAVNGVNDAIGAPTDAAQTTVNTTGKVIPYLKGILNQIASVITSIGTANTNVNTTNSNLGAPANTAATAVNTSNTLFSVIKGAATAIGFVADTAVTAVSATATAIAYLKGLVGTLIGPVNATGGSTTAGGTNAKANAVLSNIGAQGDAVTTNSIFGRLNRIGSSSDAASATGTTLFSRLSAALNILNTGMFAAGSVIKSVQRGTNAGWTTSSDINITIATVNPAKCSVTIYPTLAAREAGAYIYVPSVNSLTATALTLTKSNYYASSSYYAIPFSWEIIEFY